MNCFLPKKLSKTKRSHLKLYPHLINNIQSELSDETRISPARLHPCPTILLGLAARRAALAYFQQNAIEH